jgi:hypothetical protein
MFALLATTRAVPGRAENTAEKQSRLAARAKGDVAGLGLGEKAHVWVKLQNKSEYLGFSSRLAPRKTGGALRIQTP